MRNFVSGILALFALTAFAEARTTVVGGNATVIRNRGNTVIVNGGHANVAAFRTFNRVTTFTSYAAPTFAAPAFYAPTFYAPALYLPPVQPLYFVPPAPAAFVAPAAVAPTQYEEYTDYVPVKRIRPVAAPQSVAPAPQSVAPTATYDQLSVAPAYAAPTIAYGVAPAATYGIAPAVGVSYGVQSVTTFAPVRHGRLNNTTVIQNVGRGANRTVIVNNNNRQLLRGIGRGNGGNQTIVANGGQTVIQNRNQTIVANPGQRVTINQGLFRTRTTIR